MTLAFWISIVVLGYAVLFFAVAPIVVLFLVKQPRDPRFTEIWFGQIPPPVGEFLMTHVARLEQAGFKQVAHAAQMNGTANMSCTLTMLRNDGQGDAAIIVSMEARNGGAVTRANYVEFATQFASGLEIDTNNSSQFNALNPLPDKLIYRMFDVSDPLDLYQIHSRIAAEHGTVNQKRLPPQGSELEALNTGYTRDMRKQESRGLLRYDPALDMYRPTLLGAYRMTWKLVFPVNKILIAQERRRNLALRRKLNLN